MRINRFFIPLLIIVMVGCNSNDLSDVKTDEIKHQYFSIGEKVSGPYGSIEYTINSVTVSKLESKEGFHWLIFNINFYNLDDEFDQNIPSTFLVNGDSYFYGYAQLTEIPIKGQMNAEILFNVPVNMTEFDFYCDLFFIGTESKINDLSREIVKIKI